MKRHKWQYLTKPDNTTWKMLLYPFGPNCNKYFHKINMLKILKLRERIEKSNREHFVSPGQLSLFTITHTCTVTCRSRYEHIWGCASVAERVNLVSNPQAYHLCYHRYPKLVTGWASVLPNSRNIRICMAIEWVNSRS